MNPTNKVIFNEHPAPGNKIVGEIKLNRPQALNALDLDMVQAMLTQLALWAQKPGLKAVFLHGEGPRAFSAGGDVKNLYFVIKNAGPKQKNIIQAAQPFFETEYRLDYCLHTYPKPVVAWGHGLVMGGGAGLLWASSHQIVTPNTALSMPEAAIGFFTDVGSAYLLSRLPNGIGWYMALTGYRVNPIEAMQLINLCLQQNNKQSFYFEISSKQPLLKTLINSPFNTSKELTHQLNNLASPVPPSLNNWLKTHQLQIAELVQSKNAPTIYSQFQKAKWGGEVLQKNKAAFLQSSPSSLGIICECLKQAEHKSLKEVFQTDLTLALNCALNLDFIEGVRARLITKTNQPNWNPNNTQHITPQLVNSYFTWPVQLTNTPCNSLKNL